MEGKFNIWQKCLEIVCFVLILASSIYKGLFCDGDMGVVITLSFVAILLFIIFSIAALFPATWRMTDREKEKISDLKRYQEKYTSIVFRRGFFSRNDEGRCAPANKVFDGQECGTAQNRAAFMCLRTENRCD